MKPLITDEGQRVGTVHFTDCSGGRVKPLITHKSPLVGKTIESVKSRFEDVALHFTDGTVAVWGARLRGGEDIYLTPRDTRELGDDALLGLGVITQVEYDSRQAERKLQEQMARETKERQTLHTLLAKYGTDKEG